MVAFRRAHPVFRRRRFLVGIEVSDLAWFTPSATPMTMENWTDPKARALTIYLDGDDAPDLAEDGTPLLDDDFLVLVNGWWEPLEFRVPNVGEARTWRTELDTYDPTSGANPPELHIGDKVTLGPQSIVVLQSPGMVALTRLEART
jgi:isoamylase